MLNDGGLAVVKPGNVGDSDEHILVDDLYSSSVQEGSDESAYDETPEISPSFIGDDDVNVEIDVGDDLPLVSYLNRVRENGVDEQESKWDDIGKEDLPDPIPSPPPSLLDLDSQQREQIQNQDEQAANMDSTTTESVQHLVSDYLDYRTSPSQFHLSSSPPTLELFNITRRKLHYLSINRISDLRKEVLLEAVHRKLSFKSLCSPVKSLSPLSSPVAMNEESYGDLSSSNSDDSGMETSSSSQDSPSLSTTSSRGPNLTSLTTNTVSSSQSSTSVSSSSSLCSLTTSLSQRPIASLGKSPRKRALFVDTDDEDDYSSDYGDDKLYSRPSTPVPNGGADESEWDATIKRLKVFHFNEFGESLITEKDNGDLMLMMDSLTSDDLVDPQDIDLRDLASVLHKFHNQLES